MADKQIVELPALSQVTDETLIPVYQPGASSPAQRMSGKQFRNFAEETAVQYVSFAQDAAIAAGIAAKKAEEIAESIEDVTEDVEAAKTAARDSERARNEALAAQAAAEQARDEAQGIAGGDFLPKSGGTMTGPITLPGNPTEDLHAVPKQYVDNSMKSLDPANLSAPVPIEKGGTGAASAADARTNLEVPSKAEMDEVYARVISMGEQLVVNSNGYMMDNTNWSGWEFDAKEANGSYGSFSRTTKATVSSDFAIPVDPSKKYKMSFDMKSKNGLMILYSFLYCFDIDGKNIRYNNVSSYEGTLTKLTQDLVKGDTVIYVEDASGWLSTADAIKVWNYKNSKGYTYPAETYTRNIIGTSSGVTIDTANNTITLPSAYSGATIPAGTEISQGSNASGLDYTPLNSTTIPAKWTSYSAILGSDKILAGTAYVKIGFFWNYKAVDDVVWMTNVGLKSVEDSTQDFVTEAEMITAISEATNGLVTESKMNTAIANAIGAAIEGGY